MTLLYASTAARGAVWQRIFAAAGEPIIMGEAAVTDRAEVTAIACWQPPADLAAYPNLRAVISVGAGVDQMPALPPGVALSRTLAPGIETMVRDWVVMAALALHRDLPLYLDQGRRGLWQAHAPRAAGRTRIGIMGMGRIGTLAAGTLAAMGFPVTGWSRSARPAGDIAVLGAADLPAFLSRTDLLVCLLPLTPQTRGILGDDLFARLPQGARLVHAGRGAQLDMPALRRALDGGRIAAAMLDVTDPEPLPPDHWAWSDPRVIVTPHVAAQTDDREGGDHALSVMRALRAGQPVPGAVDPARGY